MSIESGKTLRSKYGLGYKKRLLENLDEAGSFSLRYDRSEDFGEVIQLFKSQYGDSLPHVRQSDYDHFKKLCQELQNRNMLFIRQVRDNSGELLNSSIFLWTISGFIILCLFLYPQEG